MQHFVLCAVLDSSGRRAGRALLRSMHAPLRHDLYCAVLGAYAIWGAAAAATRLHGLVQRTRGGHAMLTELQGWLLKLARLGLLAFLTLIVIPFMAGLYLDLVMLPFRQVCCLAYWQTSPLQLVHGQKSVLIWRSACACFALKFQPCSSMCTYVLHSTTFVLPTIRNTVLVMTFRASCISTSVDDLGVCIYTWDVNASMQHLHGNQYMVLLQGT